MVTPGAGRPPLAPHRDATEPGLDLPYGTLPEACAQMIRLFLVFIYIWQEDVAQISKVPGTSGNNMVSRRNHP